MLRVTKALGLTLAQWDSLPDSERIDRLAYEHRRQTMLKAMLDSYLESSKGKDGKTYIDWTAYLLLKMEQI